MCLSSSIPTLVVVNKSSVYNYLIKMTESNTFDRKQSKKFQQHLLHENYTMHSCLKQNLSIKDFYRCLYFVSFQCDTTCAICWPLIRTRGNQSRMENRNPKAMHDTPTRFGGETWIVHKLCMNNICCELLKL